MSTCTFGRFCLDLAAGQLRRGGVVVPLAPKAFTVLQHLVTRSGQLVTKDELLELAWADVHVGDGALKVCIREIRRALQDDSKTPAYIETAHRRGYRFIAPVAIDTAASFTPGLTVVPTGLAAGSITVPETHYARSGDVNIAVTIACSRSKRAATSPAGFRARASSSCRARITCPLSAMRTPSPTRSRAS